jgi:lysophospholipase L1-like esterase
MIQLRTGCLGLSLLFAGCGHSGTPATVVAGREVTSAASSSNENSPAVASDSPAKLTASVAEVPARSNSTLAPATNSSLEERFPSGLVINQPLVGGPAPGPDLPKGTTVLHIGDSFAGALGIELNRIFEQAGLHSVLQFETSTYIPTWAFDKKLGQYLEQYKPDLVLISLGANELQNPEPEKRIPLIRKLVERLGNRSCAWVAPVLWEGADGKLLDVIKANVEPCVYLDGNALVAHMPRARDKIHPSMGARPDWARAIARWLAYHRKPTSEHPWNLAAEVATQ